MSPESPYTTLSSAFSVSSTSSLTTRPQLAILHAAVRACYPSRLSALLLFAHRHHRHLVPTPVWAFDSWYHLSIVRKDKLQCRHEEEMENWITKTRGQDIRQTPGASSADTLIRYLLIPWRQRSIRDYTIPTRLKPVKWVDVSDYDASRRFSVPCLDHGRSHITCTSILLRRRSL